MSTRRTTAGQRKAPCVRFGIPALRRAMRDGATALERSRAITHRRSAAILRAAAAIEPA